MTRRRSGPEDAIHRAVAAYLRLACPVGGEVFWHHSPNGGSRNVVEAAKLKAMGVVAGVPDLMFIHGGRAHWIELKPPGKYPSISQRVVREFLFNAGCDHWAVCRSVDEVEATLRKWGIPLRATLGDRHEG